MPTALPARTPHPLEIIPLFRRWPASTARNLVYTAVWSSLIGLALALVARAFTASVRPFPALFAFMLLTSNTVGFLMHGALAALRRAAPAAYARRSWPMRVCRSLLLECCTVLGIAVPDALLSSDPLAIFVRDSALAPLLPLSAVIALLIAVVLAAGERRVAQATEAARRNALAAETARLLAEARLRALQAQIEPHFLYNTLANVVSLIGPDPDRARHMLERLIDFLRASLAASRAERSTVGAELDLAGAYLDVLAVRLNSSETARLRWRIEAEDACRALPLAPMLVQPLVENAVMHGIEPQVAGGTIALRAYPRDGRLCIEVRDDGAGLSGAVPRPGGGLGLANLRERLRSLHGDAAGLQLLENQAGGVTARLLLPLP
jgi:signal transduction histidine kinase